MSGSHTTLERLLVIRRVERRAAEISLREANAGLADVQTRLSTAERGVASARAELEGFARETATKRSAGFTIAQRQLDAEGERALRAALDDAELIRKQHKTQLDDALQIVEDAKSAYMDAEKQWKLIQRRVEAQRTENVSNLRKAEQEEALDAFAARDYDSQRIGNKDP